MKTVIHWFRRDLRVRDNVALTEACRKAAQVIPVFIFEDAFHSGPDVGAARLAFLLQSVEALRKNLAVLGYSLVVRRGKSEVLLPQLCKECAAQAVFANKRYEPYAQHRDERIHASLLSAGFGFELFKDAVAWEESEILNQQGKPYTVFTPYSKAWKMRPIPAPKPALPPFHGPFPRLESHAMPADTESVGHSLRQSLPPSGERAASELLRRFMDGPVYQYGKRRDFPALAGTSGFSPHLRAGTLGVRTILCALAKARMQADAEGRAGCDVFLNELIWREFYLQVLYHFPHVTKGAFRPQYDLLKWSSNRDHFDAWCNGVTGYPIVDAAMRCLNATGTMHNRLRMITAMFLTKDLMLNWQWGERYFMKQLVDGDMAANNGGWQWSAGTGTDAAPYFRIFNPSSQSEKFDPKGDFIREWIPELSSAPMEMIHAPWETPVLLAKFKYPQPIVAHDIQREKCLEMFKAVK